MGAKLKVPPPDSMGRPSFAAVVGSVDSMTCRYVSACRLEMTGQDTIPNLESMTRQILVDHINFKKIKEKKSDAQAKPRVSPV